MKKDKILEAIIVISTGFLLLFVFNGQKLFLYIALGSGLTGILVKPLARIIAVGWYKLGDLLGFVVSKVILTVIFFLFLAPIAFLHNIFNKDILRLKNTNKSFWSDRKHDYSSDDLRNIW